MAMGIVIPADDNLDLTTRTFETPPDYQAAVGGYVEYTALAEPTASLFVNEEGKIRHLPDNERATLIMRMHNRIHDGDSVAGDAVLIGPENVRGESTDVPEKLCALLFEWSTFVIEIQLAPLPREWITVNGSARTWDEAYRKSLDLMWAWGEILAARVRSL
jgi:hypothetical protein